MLKDARSAIGHDAQALLERIKEHIRAQKELWQQIPWLALQADGRHHSLFAPPVRYRGVHAAGYWRISCNGNDIDVDCETGEIYERKTTREGHPHFVLALALTPSCLDAQAIIDKLRREACTEHDRGLDPEKQGRWRERTAKRFGLEEGKPFVRLPCHGHAPRVDDDDFPM